ncbi:hypothetical protein ACJ73_01236 [Blastomyces percursus]|uniref:Uncharacterized protein n=1 Tax=Blastomyces percursus TaxID=1658174 RepID=A0A1J9RHA9_9EURO|nr:hypothetical protein ACJ73_01236 [Blastomyces percursus]
MLCIVLWQRDRRIAHASPQIHPAHREQGPVHRYGAAASRHCAQSPVSVISTVASERTFEFLDKDGDLFDYIKTTEESLPLMQMIALLPGW